MENTYHNQANTSSHFDIILNIFRAITMLEKALERKARQSYLHTRQYPDIYFEIQAMLLSFRRSIETNKIYCHTRTFHRLSALALQDVCQLMTAFTNACRPSNGKKQRKKSIIIKEHESIVDSINKILSNIQEYIEQLRNNETAVGIEVEKALTKSFHINLSKHYEKCHHIPVSKRGKKTIIFPCSDKSFYNIFVNDKKEFRIHVVENINKKCKVIGHKKGCNGEKGYNLKGFRQNPRKPILEGGKQEVFPIRMIECKCCKQKFSLLPSFLPREKHFGINIIGNILRAILLSGNSLNSASENMKLTGYTLRSKQTLLNWIAWMGFYHPATLLTQSGIKGSGYFQEDEGFEKEPDLRTYTVAMVDSKTLLVWHLDYVDRVDEATLCESFEKFVQRINFNVIGVTKDKWKASTNALRSVFHNLWIGFCHRHCLKKYRQALSEYQEQTHCDLKEVKRLYNQFKEILNSSTSKITLITKLNMCKESAFDFPPIHKVIEQVKQDAAQYIVHNRRKGIKKTTSLVDNFLKIVKRKLRQVESFRDRHWTAILFRAMANTRNFLPFFSGAKNAHKSPFILANGKTYDLPWIQTMNVHNAFLFSDAFH